MTLDRSMSQLTQPQISGSCACGRIGFHISALPRLVSYCYCQQCAKITGAGFLPVAHFSPDDVQWTQKPDVWRSSRIAERGMCSKCGSTISMTFDKEPDDICLTIGLFDKCLTPVPPPQMHIFLQEKLDWVIVPDDGAERYDLHRPEFQNKINEWTKDEKEVLNKN